MGKYPAEPGDGAGSGNPSPFMGKYPVEPGDGAGSGNSSPFMGKYPAEPGDGAGRLLAHADAQAKNTGSVEVRGVVEVAAGLRSCMKHRNGSSLRPRLVG